MRKRGNIVSYTAEELAAMRRRGEDRTDWAKVDATTPEEVERQAAEDGDILPEGWEKTMIMGLPPGKEAVNLRIDSDVLEWFRRTGKGYQTRINNVLRAFVESRKHTARS
jgi:uncharacterized protein (DUF4415 family)